jgi:hypothetical protein
VTDADPVLSGHRNKYKTLAERAVQTKVQFRRALPIELLFIMELWQILFFIKKTDSLKLTKKLEDGKNSVS